MYFAAMKKLLKYSYKYQNWIIFTMCICFFVNILFILDYCFLNKSITNYIFHLEPTLLYSVFGVQIIKQFHISGIDFLLCMGKHHPELGKECDALASIFDYRCLEVLTLLESKKNILGGVAFSDYPGHIEIHQLISCILELCYSDINFLGYKGFDISRMSALLCHLDGCFSQVFKLSPEHILTTLPKDEHVFVLKGWCNMHYYPFVRDKILPFAGDISLAQMKLLTATPVIIDLPSMAPLT